MSGRWERTWCGWDMGEKSGWADGDQVMEKGPPVLPQGHWGAQMLSQPCVVRGLLGRRTPWPTTQMVAKIQRLGQGD